MVRSVHARGDGCCCCGWLSLGCVPPFTDSTLDQGSVFLLGGMVWVWLGGTLLLLGFGHVPVFVAGGLAHCWVLRRHPCGCCSLVRLLAGRLTHSVLLWVWWCRGFGVWLCVECCIVDASILLWSSV